VFLCHDSLGKFLITYKYNVTRVVTSSAAMALIRVSGMFLLLAESVLVPLCENQHPYNMFITLVSC
jgi:hypothetical protein